jgi:hypothetical protein
MTEAIIDGDLKGPGYKFHSSLECFALPLDLIAPLTCGSKGYSRHSPTVSTYSEDHPITCPGSFMLC